MRVRVHRNPDVVGVLDFRLRRRRRPDRDVAGLVAPVVRPLDGGDLFDPSDVLATCGPCGVEVAGQLGPVELVLDRVHVRPLLRRTKPERASGQDRVDLIDGPCPPTINLDNPSVETPIDLVPHKPVERTIDVALSNSFGFGGTNASLVFRRHA